MRTEDVCGNVDTQAVAVTIPATLPFGTTTYYDYTCADSTAAKAFSYSSSQSNPRYRWSNVSLISGPKSFTPSGGTTQAITYPISLVKSTYVSNADTNYTFRAMNMPEGTYMVEFSSACGKDTIQVAITRNDLKLRRYAGFRVIGRCPNSGGTQLVLYTPGRQLSNGIFSNGNPPIISGVSQYTYVLYSDIATANPATVAIASGDSIVYTIPAQSNSNVKFRFAYVKDYYYNNYQAALVTPGSDCNRLLVDTPLDLTYRLPAGTSTSALSCADSSSNAQVVVQNVNGGIAPYTYELLTPSLTTVMPSQSSPVFNTTAGTYTVRITDQCGNAVTDNVSTTRMRPAITVSKSPCQGDTITLSASAFPNATYEWTNKSGTVISNTQKYTINGYNLAVDSGTYRVRVSFPNCPDTTLRVGLGDCIILPVTLQKFTFEVRDCKGRVNFQTATEDNVKAIYVETSADGAAFRTVGEIIPKGAGSIYRQDFSLANGKNYVRLRTLDVDGRSSYSRVLEGTKTCTQQVIIASPNPVNDRLYVSGLNAGNEVWVTDLKGAVLARYRAQDNVQAVDFEGLAAGLYFVKVLNGTQVLETFKIVK